MGVIVQRKDVQLRALFFSHIDFHSLVIYIRGNRNKYEYVSRRKLQVLEYRTSTSFTSHFLPVTLRSRTGLKVH